MGEVRTSAHFEIKEVIGELMSLRLLQPDGSYKNLAGTTAETPTTLDIGELPTLGIYGGFRRLPL